jgi:hypothetical protein
MTIAVVMAYSCCRLCPIALSVSDTATSWKPHRHRQDRAHHQVSENPTDRVPQFFQAFHPSCSPPFYRQSRLYRAPRHIGGKVTFPHPDQPPFALSPAKVDPSDFREKRAQGVFVNS